MKLRYAAILLPLLLSGCYMNRRSPHEPDTMCMERMIGYSWPFARIATTCATGPVAPDGRRELVVWQDPYIERIAHDMHWPTYEPTDAEVKLKHDVEYGVTPGTDHHSSSKDGGAWRDEE